MSIKTKDKRTNVDWSNHELIISKDGSFLIHELKKPGTNTGRVKFINGHGVLLVVGDYYRWSFCREFHPSATGSVSDSYWVEKLRIGNLMNPYEFSMDLVKEEFEELKEDYIRNEHGWYEEDAVKEVCEFVDRCIQMCEDEHEYIDYVRRNIPEALDWEDIPTGKRVPIQLNIIFDAFEEICKRIKNFPDLEQLSKGN